MLSYGGLLDNVNNISSSLVWLISLITLKKVVLQILFLAHAGVSYLFISHLSARSLWCQDEAHLVRNVPSVVSNQTTLEKKGKNPTT